MADISDEACGSSLQAINEICAHRIERQPLLTSFAEAGDLSALLVRHAPPLSEGNLNGPKDPQSAFPLKRHQFRLAQSPWSCRSGWIGAWSTNLNFWRLESPEKLDSIRGERHVTTL
jgi:hypothetical protein